MNPTVAFVLGVLAAVVITVLLYVKVLPRKKDGKLKHKWLQHIHDYFHFKKLYLEDVLKALFVLATIGCITCGFMMLISAETCVDYTDYSVHTKFYFGYGLALMIGGPIALRLVYEFVMMFILLVKNVTEINSKLKTPEVPVVMAQAEVVPVAAPAAPAAEPEPAPAEPEPAPAEPEAETPVEEPPAAE